MSSNDPPKITSSTVLFSVPPPGDTRPHLKVLEPGQGKLYEQNYVDVEKEILIENLRTREPGKTTTLDVEGFQLFSNCPQTTKLLFADEEEIVQDYYPESVELVKKLTGASQVIPFHHSKHTVLDFGLNLTLSCQRYVATSSVTKQRKISRLGGSTSTCLHLKPCRLFISCYPSQRSLVSKS